MRRLQALATVIGLGLAPGGCERVIDLAPIDAAGQRGDAAAGSVDAMTDAGVDPPADAPTAGDAAIDAAVSGPPDAL